MRGEYWVNFECYRLCSLIHAPFFTSRWQHCNTRRSRTWFTLVLCQQRVLCADKRHCEACCITRSTQTIQYWGMYFSFIVKYKTFHYQGSVGDSQKHFRFIIQCQTPADFSHEYTCPLHNASQTVKINNRSTPARKKSYSFWMTWQGKGTFHIIKTAIHVRLFGVVCSDKTTFRS